MSRIGKRQLTIPSSVNVTTLGNKITVKGPKGELTTEINRKIKIELNDNTLTVLKADDSKKAREMHGTTNSIIANMIIGVTEGFQKSLEILGVGYRFVPKGSTLVVNAGYSHPVELKVPAGLTVEGISNTEIKVSGIDKCLVGEFAANIRKIRQPEPYKGKGIRYVGEVVRRKEGKKEG